MSLNDSNKKEIKERLIKIRRREEEGRAKLLAEKLNLSYLNLSTTPIDYEHLANIPKKKAEESSVIAIQRKNKVITLATTDPENLKAKELIKNLQNKGFECKIYVVSPTSFKKGLSYYEAVEKQQKKRSLRSVFIIEEKELEEFKESLQTVQKLEETINVLPTSRLLTIIMAGAIEMKASDVHIEPSQKNIRLRYRIDGLLQDIVDFPVKQYAFLLSKIKMLADMLLNVHDISQDGRFSINITEDQKIKKTIDLRVSVLPSNKGESIVIRLLGLSAIKLDIEELGVRSDLFKIIKGQIGQPNGMILTTGPTGSGKTTTLYACLNYVNKPGKKIITVENPVEYQLAGITQTQISRRKGHTFGKALRAIVRQDPDILMIGEIRDEESAEIAIQFSLTGHLVFSTLHTNDAAGAIPRLNGMGIDSPSLAAAINMVIAQRLVRKLCPHCKKKYNPINKEKEIIEKILSTIPESGKKEISKEIDLYQPVGCQKCHGLGYSGRVGIFELFVVSDAIKKIILERGADYQLQMKAREEGMTTLMQGSIIELIQGKTTLEEIERVIGSPELEAKKLLAKPGDAILEKKGKLEIKREREQKEIFKIKDKIQKKNEGLRKKEEIKQKEILKKQREIIIRKRKKEEEEEKRIKEEEKKKKEEEAERIKEEEEKRIKEEEEKEKEKKEKEEAERKEKTERKHRIIEIIRRRNKERGKKKEEERIRKEEEKRIKEEKEKEKEKKEKEEAEKIKEEEEKRMKKEEKEKKKQNKNILSS